MCKEKPTIAIIRTDGIGDYILFRNFIKYYKVKGYKLLYIGNETYKDLSKYLGDDFDYTIWVNINKLKYNYFYRVKFLCKVNTYNIKYLINPMYSRTYSTDTLVKYISADKKIGIDGDCRNISNKLKTITDKYYDELINVHNINFEFNKNRYITWKFQSLSKQVVTSYILGNKESLVQQKLHLDIEPYKIWNKYVVLNVGAGLKRKRWSIKNYLSVSNYLISLGYEIILTGGNRINIKDWHIINLTGKTNLYELTSIIKGASLLVTNDSCALHIAAACGIKTIGIASTIQLGRFTPYPIRYRNIFTINKRSVKNIAPEEVIEIINDILCL